MSASAEEMAALHAFCSAERELLRISAETKSQVRDAVCRRDECITELLACMEDKHVECVSVSNAGMDVKYARITQSHTTRDLTPTLMHQAIVQRHADIVAMLKSKGELTTDDVINCIYTIVKDERNTYKPIVTFSNHLPRGLDAAGIVDVTTDPQLQQLVLATKKSQAEHAQLLQQVRTQKQALEEQRDAHVEHVQAFLQRQESNKQCLVDGSGNLFYLSKKTVKRSTPLTVAQFKALLSTALEQLEEVRCEDTGLPPPEQLVQVLTQLMDQTKTQYQKDIIKLKYDNKKRRLDAESDEEE